MYNYNTRSELITQLRATLSQTSSNFSISGPGNIGKSELLRSVARLDFSLLGVAKDPKIYPIYVDFNLRADDSMQAFYELILRAILSKLRSQGSFNLSRLEELYAQLCASSTGMFSIAHRFLTAIDIVFGLLSVKLILLLDEFDQPFQNLPHLAFLHLRALHDHYSPNLSYVVATNLPLLACGRDDYEGIAEFYELFDSENNTIRLHGLNALESNQLACKIAPTLSPEQLALLYSLAGGHPLLTQLVARRFLQHAQLPFPELEAALQLDPEIQQECKRIWASLPQPEQQILLQNLEGIKILSNYLAFVQK